MASQSNGGLASWLEKWHPMPTNLLGPGRADLHLGRGASPRPDTLMQTAEIIVSKPLANGARHTFSSPPGPSTVLHVLDEVFGRDFWPYGVEPNRPTLEALITYLHDQAIIPKTIPIEDLFVPTYGYPNVGSHNNGREGLPRQPG